MIIGAFAVLGEVKPGVFHVRIDPKADQNLGDIDQSHGHNGGEQADNHQGTKLRHPGARTKSGDHDRAKNPANTMDREHIQRVVDPQFAADQIDHFLTENARDRTNHQRLNRGDKPRGRGDRGQPGDGAGDDADKRGFAILDPLPKRPGH